MPDLDQTPTTTDAGPSTEVNTSTNEEAQATDVTDQDLEDIEVSLDELDDGETDESEESESDEAATESTDDETEESAADVQEEESKEVDTASEDEKNRAAQEAYRQREAQREARNQALQKAQLDHLQEAQELYDQAIDRGLSEQEAQMEVNREAAVRQLQIDAYNNRIEGNNNKLENGIDKAYADIDIFQKGTPEQIEELLSSLDDFERMYVQRDAYGYPTNVKGDVYQYLQQKADSIRRLTGVGARQATKAKAETKTRTDTIPSRAPKEPKVDKDLADFENAWK